MFRFDMFCSCFGPGFGGEGIMKECAIHPKCEAIFALHLKRRKFNTT